MSASELELDQPIKLRSRDVLGRSQFVERLARALIDPKTKTSTGLVLGITGEWGSGKSSILNLLHRHIKCAYPNAVVIRFSPWLVTETTTLVGEFFSEFIAAVKPQTGCSLDARQLIRSLTEYGKIVAPGLDYVAPGVGFVAQIGMKWGNNWAKRTRPLTEVREGLIRDIARLEVPIVVLIDELDRVSDHEIQTTIAVVKAIADFPGVSYLLAYDATRVASALSRNQGTADITDGHAYLEKVVQHSFAIPILLQTEIDSLLRQRLADLNLDAGQLRGYGRSTRLNHLLEMVVGRSIRTPRDLVRVVGTFAVLNSMVSGEVDIVDVFGFAILLVKYPNAVESIRRNPDEFVEDPRVPPQYSTSDGEVASKEARRITASKALSVRMTEREISPELLDLMQQLFRFQESYVRDEKNRDCICYRRPLLTILRLGLLPGAISRQFVLDFVEAPPLAKRETLVRLAKDDRFSEFTDRIPSVYGEEVGILGAEFWCDLEKAVGKEDLDYPTSRPLQFWMPLEFANLFVKLEERFLLRDPEEIIKTLIFEKSNFVGVNILRFSVDSKLIRPSTSAEADFQVLEADECLELCKEVARRAMDWLATGVFLRKIYEPQIPLILFYSKLWNDDMKQALTNEISREKGALDALMLMFFGRGFQIDTYALSHLVDFSVLRELLTSSVGKLEATGETRSSVEKGHRALERMAMEQSVSERT